MIKLLFSPSRKWNLLLLPIASLICFVMFNFVSCIYSPSSHLFVVAELSWALKNIAFEKMRLRAIEGSLKRLSIKERQKLMDGILNRRECEVRTWHHLIRFLKVCSVKKINKKRYEMKIFMKPIKQFSITTFVVHQSKSLSKRQKYVSLHLV